MTDPMWLVKEREASQRIARTDDGGADVFGAGDEGRAEGAADECEEPERFPTAKVTDARDGNGEDGGGRVPALSDPVRGLRAIASKP
jgi:hypothetical protein